MEPIENTSDISRSSPGEGSVPEKVTTADEVRPEVDPSGAPMTDEPKHEGVLVPRDEGSPRDNPADQSRGNRAGALVLQWLTYAFWLWFAGSMAWLVAITLNFFIAGSGTREWGVEVAYPLAASIVMLLVALVCDVIYTRFEPPVKRGGSSVIMLVHAVLFGLATVGAMITALFAAIMMLVNSDPTDMVDGVKTTIATALVMMVLLGAIFVRVLFVDKIRRVRPIFWLLTGLVAVGFMAASVAGPIMEANRSKDDRLIEDALPTLAQDISSYANKNNKLPEKLSDVTSNDSYGRKKVQAMLDKQLVTYKPNTQPAARQIEIGKDSSMTTVLPPDLSRQVWYYQLCVTYKTEKNQDKAYEYTAPDARSNSGASWDDLKYSSSPMTYSHKAGEVCYDLRTDEYYAY